MNLNGFDKHGRRVFLMRGGKINPDKQSIADQFRLHFIITVDNIYPANIERL